MQSAEATLKEHIYENVLECCLCLDTFKEPRSLPCQHSFCEECLQSDIDNRSRNGKYNCPTCRAETETGQDGAKKFQRNIHLGRLIEIIQVCSDEKKKCDVCHLGGTDETATHRCFDCSEMLCGSCKDIHKRFRVSANHNVFSLEDIQAGKCDDFLNATQAEPCPEHSKTTATYFCSECKRLVCIDCINVGKCKHVDQRKTIEETRESTQQELRDTCLNLQKEIGRRAEQIEEARGRHDETVANLGTYRKLVQGYVDGLKAEIDVLGNKHLERVESQFKERLNDITDFQNMVKSSCDTLKNRVEQCENLLKIASLSEMLLYKTCLEGTVDVKGESKSVPKSITAEFVKNERARGFMMTGIDGPIGFAHFVEKLWEYSINVPSQEAHAITGLAILPNSSNVALLDRVNNRLFMIDRKGNHKGYSMFPNLKLPWDCAVVKNGDLIVRMKNRKMLQCLRWFEHRQMWVEVSKIGMTLNTLGLAVTPDDNIVVTSFDPPALCIVTKAGQEILKVENDYKKDYVLLDDPRYVTVNSKGQIIFTDWMLNTVTVLSPAGKLLSRYSPGNKEHLNEPHGVCTDDNDFIYVCDRGNNRILQFYPNAEFSRVVISEDYGLVKPMVIDYDPDSCALVVGETNGAVKAFRFKL